MTSKPKFVYFDVGSVLIKDFDSVPGKWPKMKKVMGVKPSFDAEFDKMYNEIENQRLCIDLPVDSAIPLFEEKFGMQFPENFSIQNYFLDNFEQNLHLLPVVKEIAKSSRIGLLTNQYVGMFDEIVRRHLLPSFNWEIIVDSSKVKMRKPDSKIFDYALKKSGVEPRDILFVDNNAKNIEVAKGLGWGVFLYNPSDFEKSSRNLLEYYLSF